MRHKSMHNSGHGAMSPTRSADAATTTAKEEYDYSENKANKQQTHVRRRMGTTSLPPPPSLSSPSSPLSPSSDAGNLETGSSSLGSSKTGSSTRAGTDTTPIEMDFRKWNAKSQWIGLAVASGACAAINGAFAKLTTTESTSSLATAIGKSIGLGEGSGGKLVEAVVRGFFLVLNIIFNGIMWTLFTKALARSPSTTQVSILNTSSNFMITAVLGFIIFSESLPPLWWLGAALLVAGNVIIGRREEKEAKAGEDGVRSDGVLEAGDVAEEVELLNDVDTIDTEAQRVKLAEDADLLDFDAGTETLTKSPTVVQRPL